MQYIEGETRLTTLKLIDKILSIWTARVKFMCYSQLKIKKRIKEYFILFKIVTLYLNLTIII
jgi:hypothetical protein